MTLAELQTWVMSDDGLYDEIDKLRRHAALLALAAPTLQPCAELAGHAPNWSRLLLAASVLGTSAEFDHLETALMISQAAMQFAEDVNVRDAGALIVSQMSNRRALTLAVEKGHVEDEIDARIGVSEQLFELRRDLEQTIYVKTGLALHDGGIVANAIEASHFQRDFWTKLMNSSWVSATAPTAAGKTHLVLQWLLERFCTRDASLAVFVAPTRALVAEIERTLLDAAASIGLQKLRVGSLPISALGDGSRPTILVFTQERLQVFLNAAGTTPIFDIVIVDEAHKISDGTRGVILQDAIERLAVENENAHFVFLSPLTENPETLLEDAPARSTTATAPSQTPTVVQNVILADQVTANAQSWALSLRRAGEQAPLGVIQLHSKPSNIRKRLSYLALALGRHGSGTLVYANGADEAETIASQIYDSLAADVDSVAPLSDELKDLADFARDTIHPHYALVEFVRRGVAFHYGNMPSLLRLEIERLFKSGVIRFLVCTSTLVEGVNLACQTIIVRGPRKGGSAKMTPHDFWNLAGRAGRWGQDFQGNIVCVDASDTSVWPQGVPRRARYGIMRKTQETVRRSDELLAFVGGRAQARQGLDEDLEQVTAYLLGWLYRHGSIAACPAMRGLGDDTVADFEAALSNAQAHIRVPREIVLRHAGVSGFAMQSLLEFFEARTNLEALLPPSPESRDAQSRLIAIFHRVHDHMFPTFIPPSRIPVQALTTVNWMRGYPLARMIGERLTWLKTREEAGKGKAPSTSTVIRDTMKDVEEVARFKAPKFLAAYIDVLKHFLAQKGRLDLFDDRLDLELYLEFGVGTLTQLSMIGLGLSRTSAVELNDWLGDDELGESAVLERLRTRRWEGLNIPNIVKREIAEVVGRHDSLAA